MTGRERVIACLKFQGPDRVPRDLWTLPWVILFQKDEYERLIEKYPMDISRPQLSPVWRDDVVEACRQVGTYKDDWGSIWQVGEPGVIGEVKEPALGDLSRLSHYRLPWHLIESRDYDMINRRCEESDLFMLSDVAARPFERLQFLRGTENLFIDLAYGTAEIQKLIQMVHEYYLQNVESWCRTSVDGIVFMDDWGTNNSLFISPQMWREIFKPLYRDYCDLIHSHGKFAFFHTDGYVADIFGDFIEIGVDAINAQIFRMSIEDLARRYKGKVTFWGEIDSQHILPLGSAEEVYDAVMRVRRALDDGAGGVIAQCEWGKHYPVTNIETVFKAWLEPVERTL
ncbi:MAG TPA: methyltransferase [Firmicutes bacterium]|nr:methyltransferase [Bacillota bacterium]